MVRLKLKNENLFSIGKICLNSTMVRLKRFYGRSNYAHTKDLNSTMVRLKRKSRQLFSISKTSLNYTMVRLKLLTKVPLLEGFGSSQFHYGSIKTKVLDRKTRKYHTSQFHYGSIKTLNINNKRHTIKQSQFHYGSIKT